MKSKKKKKGLKIFIAILLVLIAIRIALPYVVLHYGNKALAEMDGYYGHMEDVDLALYRGAYKVKKMYLNKVDSVTGEQTEFVKVELTDLSIEWAALFQGSIVGEVRIENPEISFTKEKVEPKQIIKDSNDFRRVLKKAMPLDVNKLTIHSGKIRYIDKTSDPNVDISLTEIELLAKNLTNSSRQTETLPSPITMTANLYKGKLSLDMGIDLLEENPTFDLTTELNNTDLTELNDFFKVYGKFDVNKGEFGLYTEFAAKDGNFKGYVKPVLKDLDVLGKEDSEDGLLRKTWEGIVGTAGDIFKNQKQDQVATKVPIEGSFNNPDILTLEAIWNVLKNAFIKALMPAVDQQISINSVEKETQKDNRGLLERMFSSGKEKNTKKGTE